MCTENVIPAKSAMPQTMRKSILVAEGLRRLRNNCLSSPLEDQVMIIRDFNKAMMISGYTEKYRLQITTTVLHKYMAQLDSHEAGKIHFYRSKRERKDFKKSQKINSLKTG